MHNFVLFGSVRYHSLFAQWEKGKEKELFSQKKCKNLFMWRPESGFAEISAKLVALVSFHTGTNKLRSWLLRLHRLVRVQLKALAQPGVAEEEEECAKPRSVWGFVEHTGIELQKDKEGCFSK